MESETESDEENWWKSVHWTLWLKLTSVWCYTEGNTYLICIS